MIQLESPKTVKHSLIISGQVDLKCIAKVALSLVFLVINDHSIIYAARKASKSKERDFQYVEAKSFRRFNETAFLSDRMLSHGKSSVTPTTLI